MSLWLWRITLLTKSLQVFSVETPVPVRVINTTPSSHNVTNTSRFQTLSSWPCHKFRLYCLVKVIATWMILIWYLQPLWALISTIALRKSVIETLCVIITIIYIEFIIDTCNFILIYCLNCIINSGSSKLVIKISLQQRSYTEIYFFTYRSI